MMVEVKYTYRDSGVDIDAGDQAVDRIKSMVARTHNSSVLAGLGSFGALYGLNLSGMEEPVLVSGTDGVGTKIKLAMQMDIHDTVGIDLVAMCVNDVLAQGARPLFFLDYLALNKVIPEKVELLVKGIVDGCSQADCALIGGETAEMSDLYGVDEYDMAGFAVGIVDKKKIITGDQVEEGDVLIGMPSSGIHSNGYSLVRKIFSTANGYDYNEVLPGLDRSLGEVLLTPTKIYVKPVMTLLEKYNIVGLAHITGGGLVENVPRTIPAELQAVIVEGSWPRPAIFALMEEAGVESHEMYRTFNQGIGMVIVVKPAEVASVQATLSEMGEKSYIIGKVGVREAGEPGCVIQSV